MYLSVNQSYARVSDAAEEWEVKGGSPEKYVTPSTNNKTINSHAKMEKFEEHDGIGIGMAISAMSVVFFGLLLLFISFKLIGKASVSLSKRNAMKVKGITDKKEAKEKKLGEAPGEVFAAYCHGNARNAKRCTRCGRNCSYHHPCQTQLFTMEF